MPPRPSATPTPGSSTAQNKNPVGDTLYNWCRDQEKLTGEIFTQQDLLDSRLSRLPDSTSHQQRAHGEEDNSARHSEQCHPPSPRGHDILQQAKGDPMALQDHMKNAGIRGKIQKLIAAGVIRMGPRF